MAPTPSTSTSMDPTPFRSKFDRTTVRLWWFEKRCQISKGFEHHRFRFVRGFNTVIFWFIEGFMGFSFKDLLSFFFFYDFLFLLWKTVAEDNGYGGGGRRWPEFTGIWVCSSS